MNDLLSDASQRAVALGAVVFEMNWPSFTWITEVRVRESSGIANIAFVFEGVVPESERTACTKMSLTFVDLIFDSKHWKCEFDYIPWIKRESVAGHTLAIDVDVFKRIAKDVAPWRLDLGR